MMVMKDNVLISSCVAIPSPRPKFSAGSYRNICFANISVSSSKYAVRSRSPARLLEFHS